MKELIKKTISMYEEPKLLRIINFIRKEFSAKFSYTYGSSVPDGTKTDYFFLLDGDAEEIKQIKKMLE